MKKILMAAALLLSVSAQANDQYVPVLECRGEGVSLAVLEGGITGLPMIQIKRSEDSVSTYESHLVRVQDTKGRIGAPTTYVGKKISLSINYTTAPNKDGSRTAVLITKGNPKKEVLACRRAR